MRPRQSLFRVLSLAVISGIAFGGGSSVLCAPVSSPAETASDQGLLQPAWFGNTELTFSTGRHISYYWVKPGLQLAGKTLHIQPWEAPVMLRKDATDQDKAKATELNAKLPGDLQKGFQRNLERHGIQLATDSGDYLVSGRIVDFHGGSTLTKAQGIALMTGAWVGPVISRGVKKGLGKPADDGMECVTFDLKLVDAKTHELVLAVHEKSYNPFNAEKAFDAWAKHFGRFLAEGRE